MRLKSSKQAGAHRGVRLRVEALERRECLSVSVSTIAVQSGNELRITGDSDADTINIVDQGNGHIDVSDGSGTLLGSADGVKVVKLDAKQGQDIVNYTLANTLTNTERVVLNLGNKADQATVDLTAGIRGANLQLEVNGGKGADAIAVSLGSLKSAKAHVVLDGGEGADTITVTGTGTNVGAGSLLSVVVSGDAGKDVLTTNISGRIQGTLAVETDGNKGADVLVANISADVGSTGVVRTASSGNKAVDNVTLNAVDNSLDDDGQSTLAALHAKIFNPGAVDDLTHTDNVAVITKKAPAKKA